MNKFKSIRTKMLVSVLAVVSIAMIFMAVTSISSSRNIINDEIQKQMDAALEMNAEKISSAFDKVKSITSTVAYSVSSNYGEASLDEYESIMSHAIYETNLAIGGGIWFEPYLYDPNEKYVGPYAYKDGDTPVVTYQYSNAEYNYFSYDWYQNAFQNEGAAISDPFNDEALGLMTTCAVKTVDKNGNTIGAVSLDLTLEEVDDLITSIQIGKAGHAFLLNAKGDYISHYDSAITINDNILTSENASLADAGKNLLARDVGYETYVKDNEGYRLYFKKLEDLNWFLCIELPEKQLTSQVTALTRQLVVIATISAILIILVLIIQINSITGSLKKVDGFARKLSDGDFSIEPLKVHTADEIGTVGKSLNNMYENNKSIVVNIAKHANILRDESQSINNSADSLSSQFDSVIGIMSNVNEDMITTSASTQEMTASVQEVSDAIHMLSDETQRSSQLAKEIMARANKIAESSKISFEKSSSLTENYKVAVAQSIENAKVIEAIEEMADVISGITEQINLLSLNASIEAARAGEAGRGFAVVAGEIGNLVQSTNSAVTQIKDGIPTINDAINDLVKNTQVLLAFVTDTVTPDYNAFVDVAAQYGDDAKAIEELSDNLSVMSGKIEQITNELVQTINIIAESSQNTAANSSDVMNSMNVVMEEVTAVADLSVKQNDIVDQLSDVVNGYRLQ